MTTVLKLGDICGCGCNNSDCGHGKKKQRMISCQLCFGLVSFFIHPSQSLLTLTL